MAKAIVPIAPGQTASPPSKLQDLKTQQNAPSRMDGIQNLQLQASVSEVESYYSSNSSSPSPKGAHMSKTEVKSLKTVVMPAIMIGTTTPEEEMANIKAILEKLTRENEGKEACIKLQEEKITKLTKKIEKRPA